jgi:GTP cyclohydrolase I
MKNNDHRGHAIGGIESLLRYLGQDPTEEGLAKTPMRVVKAMSEMCAGYDEDPKEILETAFKADYDQMVILKGIAFTSLCEHHLLPFIGTATVAYIPKGRVVGLSKLARLTMCFARRLQLQERMTTQIADALQEHVDPVGVGVIVRASHQCMACRGIRVSGATMVTSALRGEFVQPEVRAEFLRLSNGH